MTIGNERRMEEVDEATLLVLPPLVDMPEDAVGRGIISSTGQYPLASRGESLVKMYKHGRLPKIRRDEQRNP